MPPRQRPPAARNMADADEGNHIEVYVRCRPPSAREARQGPAALAVPPVLPKTEVDILHRNQQRCYEFDHVFGANATQEEVFQHAAQPLVDEFINGKNCTLFAYGQTGSGKTHTITGDVTPRSPLPPMAGITSRVLYSCFEMLSRLKKDYTLTFQYIELYNEEFYDLLDANPLRSTVKLHDQTLSQTGPRRQVLLKGAETRNAASWESAVADIHAASARRRTAATKLNSNSSRSFTILTLNLMVDNGNNALFASKFHVVDLAGSENVGRSGARDHRAQEAGQINRTLLTLGRVIQKLYEIEDGRSHRGTSTERIPYRDSKLTRLLQDSLGGSTRTCMIAAISPMKEDVEETVSTLNYAKQARCIRNRPQLVPETVPRDATLRDLSIQLERAQHDLLTQRRRDGCVRLEFTRHEQIMSDLQSQATKIDAYIARQAELEHQLNLAQSKEKQLVQDASQMRSQYAILENQLKAVQTRVANFEEIESVSASLKGEIQIALNSLQSSAVANLAVCADLGSNLRAELTSIAETTESFGADQNFSIELDGEAEKLRRQCRIEIAKTLESAEDRIRDHLSLAANTWKDSFDAVRAPLSKAAIVSSQLQDYTSGLVTSTTNLEQDLAARHNAALKSWRTEVERTDEEYKLMQQLTSMVEQRRSNLMATEPIPCTTIGPMRTQIAHLAEAASMLHSAAIETRPSTPDDTFKSIPELNLKVRIPAAVDQALVDMHKAAVNTTNKAAAIAKSSRSQSEKVVNRIASTLEKSSHIAEIERTGQGIVEHARSALVLLASEPKSKMTPGSPTNSSLGLTGRLRGISQMRPKSSALTDVGNRLNLSPRKPVGVVKAVPSSSRTGVLSRRRLPQL